MTDSNSAPRAENDAITWKQCGPCAWARNGGPPCYYHNNKFGIGKLITTIRTTAEVAATELSTAIDEELKEWP